MLFYSISGQMSISCLQLTFPPFWDRMRAVFRKRAHSVSHTVELLCVGTELLLGNILNTDARDLSRELTALGLNVRYHSVVGDNPERLRAAVEVARGRADVIITTGGLGPTCDDLTKQTLAEAFGKKLVFHPECAETIRAFFARMGRQMTDNNLHIGQRLGHRPRLRL